MKEVNKILFILHLPPPIHGATMVGESILKSSVITDSYDCEFTNLSSSKKISESGKFYFSKIRSIAIIYWTVFRTILLTKPDLCYATINSKGSAFYKDFGIVLLTKIFRIKVVYHFHNKGVSLNKDRFVDNLLYRITFHRTNVILLSPYLYYDISDYLHKEKVYFCPNGIAPIQEITRSNDQSDRCNILFISNMMKAKGVLELLAALELLKERGVDFSCDFVGEWYDIDKEVFNTTIKNKKLSDCVYSHGPIYGTEKNKFYSKADLFAFPSHDEAFPLVLLEAMQYGLPIISSREGAIPEIVDHKNTGFLVDKCDIIDLAAKIEYLILNPIIRKEFGKNGRVKFDQNYTIDIFENKMKEILDQILSQ